MTRQIRNRAAIKPTVVFLALLLLAGCASRSGIKIDPDQRALEFPSPNMEVLIDAGGIVLAKGNYFSFPGVRLHNTIEGELGVGPARPIAVLRPQFLYPQSEDDVWTYYTGNVRFYYGGTQVVEDTRNAPSRWRVGGLRISKFNPEIIEIWAPVHNRVVDPTHPAVNYRTGTPKQDPVIGEAVIEISIKESWAKELIYDGQTDDVLNFTYQEHAGDRIKPVRRTRITVKLGDDPVFEFEGARVEIFAAFGNKLHYQVLSNFP